MTTKTISGTYSAGYLLNSSFNAVSITSTGSVGGFGLIINGFAAVTNDGHLLASNGAAGLTLGASGGSLNNQSAGVIRGGHAIGSSGAGAAGKAGGAGVYMTVSGYATNSYLIQGGFGGAGVAGSFGGYGGDGGAGASFHASGDLANYGGQIFGGNGGAAGASSYSTQVRGGTGGFGGTGVEIAGHDGVVFNNSGAIHGGNGGAGGGSTGVGGYGGTGGVAVDLAAGGYVKVAGGFLAGGQGGDAGYGAGHVAGAGGRGGAGVNLSGGGGVVNDTYIFGGQGGTGADGLNQFYNQLGQGGDGVDVNSGGVENFGHIIGGAGGSAVAGARPGNGGDGVRASGGSVFNYGSIFGGYGGYSPTVKSFCGYGVSMAGVGSITNGNGSTRTAFIGGNPSTSSQGANYNGIGVVAAGVSQVTVTNWGTISGGFGHIAEGTAVFFGSSADTLIAEAGSVFLGAVAGGGGMLELAGGSGTLTGLDAGGNVTVAGFLGVGSNTTFQNFGTLEIASDGSFATTTTGTIASGKNLIDNGALTGGGTLTVNGSIGGSGTLTVNGRLTLQNGSVLTVGTVYVGARAAKVTIASNIVEAGFWDQYLGTLTVAARKTFELTGTTDYLTGKTTTNHGNLEYAGSGQLYIQNALVNDSQLIVQSGQITLEAACTVSGSGDAVIKGGTLAAHGVFNQNVFFEGAGTLGLGRSQSYTAQVVGFSTTGTDLLDLGDIGFVNVHEATFSGMASGGALTVSDGTHTAHINLAGDFLSSTFVCASDGSGGVLIHDPTQGASAPPSIHALVAAMAALGTSAGATPRTVESPAVREPLIARPHVMIA